MTGSHFGWHTLWLAATLAGNHFGWQPFLARGIHSWQPLWLAATLAGSQVLAGIFFFFLAATFGWHIHLAVRYFRIKVILVLQPILAGSTFTLNKTEFISRQKYVNHQPKWLPKSQIGWEHVPSVPTFLQPCSRHCRVVSWRP